VIYSLNNFKSALPILKDKSVSDKEKRGLDKKVILGLKFTSDDVSILEKDKIFFLQTAKCSVLAKT
jgi:hypothetical protein